MKRISQRNFPLIVLKKLMIPAMAVCLCGCSSLGVGSTKTQGISRISYALNTEISITLNDSEDESIIDGCLELCTKYENLFSRTKEGTEIYELNENGAVEASDETVELVNIGLKYCQLSGGAFDIAIEPVSSLWDFTSGEGTVPDADKIEAALPYVDYTKVKVDGNTISVEPGMGLDLGAIAKGYIADRIKDYLKEQGVESAMINLGGNILCVGSKLSGDDYGIGIRDPQDTSAVKCIVYASDLSVVTSGTYERYIEQDGVRYHHILNPKTGYSYDNDLDSVSIISEKSVDGDALSTTCFALGLEDGLKLINSLDDTYAIFIDKEGNVTLSDGLTDAFKYVEK